MKQNWRGAIENLIIFPWAILKPKLPSPPVSEGERENQLGR